MAFNGNTTTITSIIFSTLISMISLSKLVNSSISPHEVESMLSSLRSHNYNLFSNAIATSDVIYELTGFNSSTTGCFTLFAPPDSHLFSLDMTTTAVLYTQYLRYHIIPHRLPVAALRRFPAMTGSWLKTLEPSRSVHFMRRKSFRSETLTVNGVEIVVPGLFYGREVAVHGLASILNLRSPRVYPFNHPLAPYPSITMMYNNLTVFHPLPKTPMVMELFPVAKSSPAIQSGFPPMQPPALAPSQEHPIHSFTSTGTIISPPQMKIKEADSYASQEPYHSENKLLEINTDTATFQRSPAS